MNLFSPIAVCVDHLVGRQKYSTPVRIEPKVSLRAIYFLLLFYPIASVAAEWEMMLDGKSISITKDEYAVKQDNLPYFWNLYRYNSELMNDVPLFGYHKDTEIYYHVSQLVRRFTLLNEVNYVHMDLGVMGYMTNLLSKGDGAPNVSVLPLVSIGIDSFAFKVSYSPKRRDAIVDSWFVQMSVAELPFW